MKKSTRIVKRFLSLFLVVLMSINTLGAVVSDNDGSAFITKAEFDSLKNDFQAQIDNYNTSIDSKIDGAIAAYLAGIRVGTAPTNRWQILKDGLGADLWFANTVNVATGSYISTVGTSTNKAQLFVNANRHYTYRYSKFTSAWHAWKNTNGQLVGLEFGVWPAGTSIPTNSWDNSAWRLWGTTSQNSNYKTDLDIRSNSGMGSWRSVSFSEPSSTNRNNVSVNADTSGVNNDGEGSGWVYHERPDGELILREYCSKIFPGQILDAQWHTYKDMRASQSGNYTSATGLSDTTAATTITVPSTTKWEIKTSGTKRADNNETASSTYYKLNQYKVSSSNTKDYALIQWGQNTTQSIYCFADDIAPTLDSQTTVSIPQATFNSLYFTSNGGQLATNTANGYSLKYYPLKFTPQSKTLNSFIHETVSSSSGEIVKIGGGAPFIETTTAEQRLAISIVFKIRNGSSHEEMKYGNVKYELSDKQFVNGAIASGAKSFASGIAKLGDTVKLEFDVDKKSLIWINMYAEDTGKEATIDEFSIKVQ